MLRLSIYCPTPQGVTQTRSIGSLQLIKHHKPPFRRVFVVQSALKDGGDNGGTSSFQGSSSSWQPDSEIGIPFEQRPVNEYSDLKDSTLYSWAELGTGPFLLRIGGLWLGALTVLGVPISAASFDPSKDPLRFTLAAGTGTLFLVSLIVLRIYLVSLSSSSLFFLSV
ncbi:Protein CONSERVED IN THE GREEN LINEAGE AND DIATOMS 27, chloroplastic [Linum perenne]